MAFFTLFRLFKLHLFMTANALAVISCKQARPVHVHRVKSCRMAISAQGRRIFLCFSFRAALMMTSFAESLYIRVEIGSHLTIVRYLHQLLKNLIMRQLGRLEFFFQNVDLELFL